MLGKVIPVLGIAEGTEVVHQRAEGAAKLLAEMFEMQVHRE